MSEKIYKYHANRTTIWATVIYIALMVAAALFMWFMYVGGYFSAWLISLMAALTALMTLSIPRKIIVDNETVTIKCILELVEIPTNEIASIRKIETSECRWMLPLIGSRGFFGYYGYFFDLQTFDRVRFYATEWQNLVEIVDIYDDRYYVSCRQADELIEQVEGYM